MNPLIFAKRNEIFKSNQRIKVLLKGILFYPLITYRSQEKKEEAITLLKDSIRYGPEFADAYSSLASLLAEQVIVPI